MKMESESHSTCEHLPANETEWGRVASAGEAVL